MDANVGLKISNGVFSVNVFGADMVDSSKITDIRTQTNDEEKKTYTLEAVVSVGGTSGAPTDEKIYSSFVMQLTDSGIDVTIKSEDPTLIYVAGKEINFTEKTSGATNSL